MYYYESHLGGIYSSDIDYDYNDLYCEECGDSDSYLGYYENFKEFVKDNTRMFNYQGSGGYDIEEIFNCENDRSLTLNEMFKIIKKAQGDKDDNLHKRNITCKSRT